MSTHNTKFRAARPEDANILAEPVNFAGEGLPLYLWGKMAAPGETAWDVGRKRAARRLYERCGYRETARRMMVKEEWTNAGPNWVLLTRQF